MFKKERSRPRTTGFDRAFWVGLRRCWSKWDRALAIVQPETVVRWHRQGFKAFWRKKSARGPGRPRKDPEIRKAILQTKKENPVVSRNSAERSSRNSDSLATGLMGHVVCAPSAVVMPDGTLAGPPRRGLWRGLDDRGSDDVLELFDLVVGQLGEELALILRELAVVVACQPDEQVELAIG